MTARRRPDEAVILNETETRALAMRRVLWALTNHDEWLEWEDVPLLDEDGFNRLSDALDDIRNWWTEHLRDFERVEDVDSAEVEGRVS